MDIGASQGLSIRASLTEGVLKDATSSQVITKTLDKLNTTKTLSGVAVDTNYQFQKDVLGAAGIGRALDLKV